MELRHLRYFCAVAEHRSFTLAARILNVSQSGVSGQVRDLEREIGVALLRRNPREVALTTEGLVFLAEARSLLSGADRAVELAQRASRGQTGTLTVGLCGPVTAPFLPRLIQRFRSQHPGIRVSLADRSPSEQIDSLLNREIDLGFTRAVPAEKKPLLHHELLLREDVLAVVPRSHPLATHDPLPLASLAGQRLIVPSRDDASPVFDAIIAMCRRARLVPHLIQSPRSWQSMLTMVEAGEGIALVPACVQHLRAPDAVFRPLAGGRCRLDAIIAWRREDLTPPLHSFLALLRAARAQWRTASAPSRTTRASSRAVNAPS